MEDPKLVLMTAEQSKMMSGWVREGLKTITKGHADFHKLIVDQYPDEEDLFQKSIVINCVCHAIARLGIEYLKGISGEEFDLDSVRSLLSSALKNELLNEEQGPLTKQ